MAGQDPEPLVRFVRQFVAAVPHGDAVNAGIYAAKGGYHNTRDHHRRGVAGGESS